jgi:hypothetical protein
MFLKDGVQSSLKIQCGSLLLSFNFSLVFTSSACPPTFICKGLNNCIVNLVLSGPWVQPSGTVCRAECTVYTEWTINIPVLKALTACIVHCTHHRWASSLRQVTVTLLPLQRQNKLYRLNRSSVYCIGYIASITYRGIKKLPFTLLLLVSVNNCVVLVTLLQRYQICPLIIL